jgi:hypothetical protein
MSSFDGMIEAIGVQQGLVSGTIKEMKGGDEGAEVDAAKMLELSLTLMEQQQKLTIMSDSFSKTMKAHTDSQKAAINNMH